MKCEIFKDSHISLENVVGTMWDPNILDGLDSQSKFVAITNSAPSPAQVISKLPASASIWALALNTV